MVSHKIWSHGEWVLDHLRIAYERKVMHDMIWPISYESYFTCLSYHMVHIIRSIINIWLIKIELIKDSKLCLFKLCNYDFSNFFFVGANWTEGGLQVDAIRLFAANSGYLPVIVNLFVEQWHWLVVDAPHLVLVLKCLHGIGQGCPDWSSHLGPIASEVRHRPSEYPHKEIISGCLWLVKL